MNDHSNRDAPVSDGQLTRWFFRRHSASVLIGLLLLAPFGIAIAGKVLTPGDMSAYILDVSHWLPAESLWINDLDKFSDIVGRDRGSIVRVSWPGCVEDDPRLQAMAGSLNKIKWPEQFRDSDSVDTVFTEVLTIDQVADQMRLRDAKLTDEQVYDQLRNVLIGPKGTTCLLATLPTREPGMRSFAIDAIYDATDEVEGLEANDIKLFGGPVYTVQVDRSGLRMVSIFTPLSVLISVACAWFCLRSIRLMLAVFLNAIVCSCAAIVSLHLTRAPMDPLLMLLPGFWFVMSMSSGIHFVNYLLDVSQESSVDAEELAGATVNMAIWPSCLATLTTCIGLGALCTSDILPVWRFGFHAVIGLVCCFVVQFLFLPAWADRTLRAKIAGFVSGSTNGFWNRFADLTSRLGTKTAFLFLLLLVVAAIGFTRLGFSNKLSDQYPANSTVNSDAQWFERQIGPLLPFEVLVRFSNNDESRASARLAWVAQLQQKIEASGIPCRTISATALVPYQSGSGARQSMFRTILDRRLNRHREALAETGMITEEEDAQLWRLSVFAYNSRGTSMSEYFSAIRGAVESQHTDSKLTPSISYAGIGSRMAVITGKLGGGLMQSCITSAVLISLTVIIALRSLKLGLTAMLPNLFPVVVTFGAFGYFQPRLDIGSIMTASIAMGIAVDDTIHFMYWFKQGLRQQKSRRDSVRLAVLKCGRAIASTSLICGLGFFVFFFGDFMPAVRFGQLLFFMLAAALIGDLIFLPSLLLSQRDNAPLQN